MPGPNPSGSSRMGGAAGRSGGPGSRPGGPGGVGMPGGGSSESMDENSMMQALAGASGGTNGAGSSSGSSGSGSNPGSFAGPGPGGAGLGSQMSKPPAEPREVGSIGEEAKRSVEDTWLEVKKFFSINTWLGIDPETMTPEEEAKAKEFHARYQQLDQEQQTVAKQMHQEKMQKEKVKEEEEKREKEIEAQKKAQSVQMPSSPQKGAVGPGGKSKKGQAMQKLQQDRTTIGTTQGE
jgi:hypothetical protein